MPYQGETADKTAQAATLRDPNVLTALGGYQVARASIGDAEIVEGLVHDVAELATGRDLVEVTRCIAIDGSRQETPFADDGTMRFTMGFVRVGMAHIDVTLLREVAAARYIDSTKLASTVTGHVLSYALPGVGVASVDSSGAQLTSVDSWRLACNQMIASLTVAGLPLADGTGETMTLADALLQLYTDVPDEHGDVAEPQLPVGYCPGCDQSGPGGAPIALVGRHGGGCPECGTELHLIDHLGVADMLVTYGRENALNMVMDIIERLTLVAVIETIHRTDPAELGATLIVADGPLSAIRTTQKLVKPMQQYLDRVATDLEDAGLHPLLLVGVEKTGQFIEHAHTVGHLIDAGQVMTLTDEYIGRNITGRSGGRGVYGQGHMYGRRFFHRRGDGNLLVLTVPARAGVAPWSANPVSQEIDSYPTLRTVIELLEELRASHPPGAIIPLRQAHKHASLANSASDALARLTQRVLGLDQNTRLRVVGSQFQR